MLKSKAQSTVLYFINKHIVSYINQGLDGSGNVTDGSVTDHFDTVLSWPTNSSA